MYYLRNYYEDFSSGDSGCSMEQSYFFLGDSFNYFLEIYLVTSELICSDWRILVSSV